MTTGLTIVLFKEWQMGTNLWSYAGRFLFVPPATLAAREKKRKWLLSLEIKQPFVATI